MTRFQDLLRSDRDVPAQTLQEQADARFPALAASVGFRMWKPGDSVPEHGERVLIGVATYSPLDMELLDQLSGHTSRAVSGHTSIDLFNVREIGTMDDFDAFVPGIGRVFQTPVAGLWDNGRIVAKASGSEARSLILRWLAHSGSFLMMNK